MITAELAKVPEEGMAPRPSVKGGRIGREARRHDGTLLCPTGTAGRMPQGVPSRELADAMRAIRCTLCRRLLG